MSRGTMSMDPGRSIQHEISSLKGTPLSFLMRCFLRLLSSPSCAFRTALFSHNPSLTATSSSYRCSINRKSSVLQGRGVKWRDSNPVLFRFGIVLWIKGMKSLCFPLCPGVTTGLRRGSGVTIVLRWRVLRADAAGGSCCCMRHIECVWCRAGGLLQSGGCCCIAAATAESWPGAALPFSQGWGCAAGSLTGRIGHSSGSGCRPVSPGQGSRHSISVMVIVGSVLCLNVSVVIKQETPTMI